MVIGSEAAAMRSPVAVVFISTIDFTFSTLKRFSSLANISTNGPQTVYYNFRQTVVIAKFSFRNRREKINGHNPTAFDFIGSNDCKSWTTILAVDGVTWSGNDELKTWDIKEPDQLPFTCFGIRVRAIDLHSLACIQDFKMWKGEKVPARKTNSDDDDHN